MQVKIRRWKEGQNDRPASVRIDRFDTWDLPEILARVIAPALRQLRAVQCGSSFVDDEDVPEALRSGRITEPADHLEMDDNYAARWNWVLDEMIWAFEQLSQPQLRRQQYTGRIDIVWAPVPDESDSFEMRCGPNHTLSFEKLDLYDARINNGLKLFGRYYRALWE
jgi:hypothetical protein